MKKVISLILCALLAFSGICAFADEDVSGMWYLTLVSYEGMDIDPSTLGIDMTLSLNTDGTAELAAMGETAQGSWTLEGTTVTVDIDDTMVLNYDGTALTGEMEGSAVTFSREASAQESDPAEVYAENIAAFDGNWIPVKFGIAGFYVDAEMLSALGLDADALISMAFTISNGCVDYSGSTIQFNLVDGLLFAESEEGSYRIQLLEGDQLSVEMPSLPVTIVCARADVSAK